MSVWKEKLGVWVIAVCIAIPILLLGFLIVLPYFTTKPLSRQQLMQQASPPPEHR